MKNLLLATCIICLSPTISGLSLEQSRQFKEQDYILKEGITIEYRGEDQELFFLDNGRPYHYSRIEQEDDGDLFRWIDYGEMKQAKYMRYLATPRDSIPEIVVREGFIGSIFEKTIPDTICELVYDQKTGKSENTYLVDFETQIFEPVLEQAIKELQEELKLPVSREQAILLFYNRCSSAYYPVDQVKLQGDITEPKTKNQGSEPIEDEQKEKASPAKQELPPTKVEPDAEVSPPNQGKDNAIKPIEDELTIEEKVVEPPLASIPEKIEKCASINDNDYKITDDETRGQRLSSFISQLELEHAWDSEADSYSKLYSMINIAYPVFVHYEELDDYQKAKYKRLIEKTYDISDDLYKQLPCQQRNAINTVFEKILGKTR
jgi:hypothetical protein